MTLRSILVAPRSPHYCLQHPSIKISHLKSIFAQRGSLDSLTVTARAFGDPGTATSRSSPTPFTIGVLAFRGNRTMYHGDKYIFCASAVVCL
ncbi:hypothetical protein QL285_057542 [Trifolium repens]|nr:hypothetical protein QL285_057542 [Trifolium repens]